jgi:hypothetical protein
VGACNAGMLDILVFEIPKQAILKACQGSFYRMTDSDATSRPVAPFLSPIVAKAAVDV